MIYITSDHHFGHKNIIKFCDRPFSSVEEMDETLIKNWNETVNPDDTVYHLGDFTLNDRKYAEGILEQLNGKIYFVSPYFHHDKRWIPGVRSVFYIDNLVTSKAITVLNPLEILKINQEDSKYPLSITLCHYPLEEWEASYHGGLHFHGHSHGKGRFKAGRLDVAVDNWGFYPVALDELIKTAKEHLKQAEEKSKELLEIEFYE